MNNAREFTGRLQDLLRREHGALAEFLLAAAEFDERRLWVELGYASLFDFLHRELRLSKSAAFYRKTAAALIQRFPAIAESLRDGRLCLMTVAEVSRVLTPENVADVLPRFYGLSKREAKVLVATLLPAEAPPLRDIMTPLRVTSLAADRELTFAVSTTPERTNVRVLPVEPAAPPLCTGPEQAARAPEPPRPSAEPLTADLSRVHFTASRRFVEKLERARDALSHSHPGAGMEQILEAGLDLLLERDAKRKGLVKKPLPEPRPSSDPDRVPAHVRREVWRRDGGKCQWPLASGGICGSTVRVELDHRIVKARGGPPTVENLRCLCRPHNQLSARQVFGDRWMDRYARNPRGGRGEVGAP